MNDYLYFLAYFGIGGAHPGGLVLSKKLLQTEKLTNTSSVLDAGCGTGQTAAYIKNHYNCHVLGIDNNPLMVEKARNRSKTLGIDVNFERGNIEDLSMKDCLFDIVLYESVISFTDIQKTLLESLRILKYHGILIAIEMTNEGYLQESEKRELQDFYGVSSILTEDEWKKQFSDAGYKKISSKKASTFLKAKTTTFDEPGTEFFLSSNIDHKYYNVFDKHESFTNQYKDKLGFRVYRCVK